MHLSEIGAVPGDPDQEGGLFFRIFLGFAKKSGIDHIEMNMPAADIAESADEIGELAQPLPALDGGWVEAHIEEIAVSQTGQIQLGY